MRIFPGELLLLRRKTMLTALFVGISTPVATATAGVSGFLAIDSREAVEATGQSSSGRCVHETNCLLSAWCADPTLIAWCQLHGDHYCPPPHCRWEVDESATTTTSTPPPTDGDCVHQTDCGISDWCHDPVFHSWCANEGNGCPWPMCTRTGTTSDSPQTTTTYMDNDVDDNSSTGEGNNFTELEPQPEPEPAPDVEPAPVHNDSSSDDEGEDNSTAGGEWPETRPWPADDERQPETKPWPADDGNSTPEENEDGSPGLEANDSTTTTMWATPLPGDLTDENTTTTTLAATLPEESTTTQQAATLPAELPPATGGDGASSGPGENTTTSQEGPGIGSWFTQDHFSAFFPNINNLACTGSNFFTHEALVRAASQFPMFANSGNLLQDKLELAAFLGQTSHETTGGWSTAPGGPQAWGYCFKEEVGCEAGYCVGYCQAGNPCEQIGEGFDCTCVADQTYQGRGPMQLSWNYNYGQASEDIFGDASVLMENPSLVADNATVAYLAGLWFWMTPQSPKPSCHDVMVGSWAPSEDDTLASRVPGFGMVTNIINGGLECNMPTNPKVQDRVDFFRRFAGLLEVDVDEATLYCNEMRSYR